MTLFAVWLQIWRLNHYIVYIRAVSIIFYMSAKYIVLGPLPFFAVWLIMLVNLDILYAEWLQTMDHFSLICCVAAYILASFAVWQHEFRLIYSV